MGSFAVNISNIPDKVLSFMGYEMVEENDDEFKIYRDKYREDHIVFKSRPLLFVEDPNDAVFLASDRAIALGRDI